MKASFAQKESKLQIELAQKTKSLSEVTSKYESIQKTFSEHISYQSKYVENLNQGLEKAKQSLEKDSDSDKAKTQPSSNDERASSTID